MNQSKVKDCNLNFETSLGVNWTSLMCVHTEMRLDTSQLFSNGGSIKVRYINLDLLLPTFYFLSVFLNSRARLHVCSAEAMSALYTSHNLH
jgi:hypothetical protein